MSDTLVATALAFVRHGFKVLPLHHPIDRGGRLVCSCHRGPACSSPAKHPIARHERLGAVAPNGLRSATNEVGTVKHWFSSLPEVNLGVRVDSDRFALDIDPKRDGNETLAALERSHGELPPTWRTITSSGGEHIIFRLLFGLELPHFAYNPQAPEASQPLGLGIDAPLYKVAPPSRHICGRSYEWSVDHHPKDVELAEPPAWLIEKLATPKRSADGTDGEGVFTKTDEDWRSFNGIVTEYQDDACCRVAGHLFRRYVHPRLVWALMDGWNQRFCRPPIPDDELRRILDRISDKEAERRWGRA